MTGGPPGVHVVGSCVGSTVLSCVGGLTQEASPRSPAVKVLGALLVTLLERQHEMRPSDVQVLCSLADAYCTTGQFRVCVKSLLLAEAVASTWFDSRARSVLDSYHTWLLAHALAACKSYVQAVAVSQFVVSSPEQYAFGIRLLRENVGHLEDEYFGRLYQLPFLETLICTVGATGACCLSHWFPAVSLTWVWVCVCSVWSRSICARTRHE